MPITLTANEVYSSLSNMIISQTVFADNIKRPNKLIDKFRKEGSMYGDTKLFYQVDSIGVHIWPDAQRKSTSSLLSKDYPADPAVDSIKIDQFRQIRITTESVLSRRAWMSEGVFGDFNSVLLSMMWEAKAAYEDTYFDAFIGTSVGDTALLGDSAKVSLPYVPSSVDVNTSEEARLRLFASRVSETIENIMDELQDYNRLNSLGYLRSFNPNDFYIIFNNKYYNLVKYGALPTIFNKDLVSQDNVLKINHKYIGTINSATSTSNTKDFRKLAPGFLTVSSDPKYFRAGEIIDDNVTVVTNTTYKNFTHKADGDVIAIIVHKDAIEFDSAFTTQTEFWNARDLDTNHYVTFGHNTLKILAGKPFFRITLLNEVDPDES